MSAVPLRFLVPSFLLLLGAAPAAAEEVAQSGAANSLLGMLPFGLMFVVVYVLMVRPAQQQRVKQEQMLSALKRDDTVLTQSGIIGRIVTLEENVVTLELGDKVRVRMLRERITGLWQPNASEPASRMGKARAGDLS